MMVAVLLVAVFVIMISFTLILPVMFTPPVSVKLGANFELVTEPSTGTTEVPTTACCITRMIELLAGASVNVNVVSFT